MAAYNRGDYATALRLLRPLADGGSTSAQYNIGIMYDKGQGVPKDYVEAHKWVSLSVAGATAQERKDWVRIRDAIATKLSLTQITEAQRRAVAWRPERVQ